MDWFCLQCQQPDPFLPVDSSDNYVLGEHKCLPLDRIMRGMSQGTVMYKFKTADKWYKRKYKVDVQNMRMSYSPTTKSFFSRTPRKTDLCEVDEIRRGWNTDVFNRLEAAIQENKWPSSLPSHLRDILKEENCFSIIIGTEVLNLVAPNVHTRDAWVRGLNHLIATSKCLQKKQEYNRWLKDQVKKADVNNNGSLNFNECLILLKQLNIDMDRGEARRLFNDSNFKKSKLDGEDALDPEEFVHFFYHLTKRPELEDIMKKYSANRTILWGAEELCEFLAEEQKLFVSIDDCNSLINNYEPGSERVPGYLSLKGFEALMLSVDHDIFNKSHCIINQDMRQPLNHYYIASSHNTYLIHGQLIGESSVEGYVQALTRGCRCLELDAWDGPNEEPIVFHGYTLTTRILFRDVLFAIKEYAFRESQYPVILSLENHCSIAQQEKMAEYLIDILGDYLYKDPVGKDEVEYPSPEQLVRKILIKAKKIKGKNEEQVMLEEEIDQEVQMAQMASAADLKTVALSAPRQTQMLAKKLSDLVNYCSAVHFKSFDDSHTWKFYEMASFQETKASALSDEYGAVFIAHNKKHLSRIYPKGTRTDSSNYDPVPYWNVGCQLVALNYQTWDMPMYIHDSKFARNGKCGYVLKPLYLRDEKIHYNPRAKPDPTYVKHLLIKVICGHRLPKPGNVKDGEVVDPYVSIKVTGHPLDVQKKKTSYVHNNGFNPVWNELFLLTFNKPELAIITFLVKDQSTTGKNRLLGQFALPFDSVSEGYRHIHLQNTKRESLVAAVLFVQITKGNNESKNGHEA